MEIITTERWVNDDVEGEVRVHLRVLLSDGRSVICEHVATQAVADADRNRWYEDIERRTKATVFAELALAGVRPDHDPRPD